MYYVYILQSLKDEKLYVGQTVDLRKRFKEHQNGLSRSTKYRRPWKLLYYEAYSLHEEAIDRERQLKKFNTAYFELKKRIKRGMDAMRAGG